MTQADDAGEARIFRHSVGQILQFVDLGVLPDRELKGRRLFGFWFVQQQKFFNPPFAFATSWDEFEGRWWRCRDRDPFHQEFFDGMKAICPPWVFGE